MGTTKEKEVVNHVFSGDEPVRGTVQVLTNKKIQVGSVGTDGKIHVEERDCGQFVLVPPHIYRALGDELNWYRSMYGERDPGVKPDAATRVHSFVLRPVPKDDARAEIVEL